MDFVGRGSRTTIDPRTKLLALLVVNGLLMSVSSINLTPWLWAIPCVLIILDTPVKWTATFVACLVGFFLCQEAPSVWQNWLTFILGVVGFWMLRFTISWGMAAWLWHSTRVSELIASLGALRLPKAIIIPLAVVFRFLPVAIDELRGVLEAMALRGYTSKQLAVHPLKAAELIMVPLLSSSARIADELAAAAMIRGLGGPGRPTSVIKLKFTWQDLLLCVVIAVPVGVFLAVKFGGVSL